MRRTSALLIVLLALVGLSARAADAPAEVVCQVFVGTDCPIANAYAPELNRIVADYDSRGVRFRFVYPLPDATAEQLDRHRREHHLAAPVEHDHDLALARAAGVRATPEAVVERAGTILYRGRIDDRYADLGRPRREHVTSRDLRAALDRALRGEPTPQPWPAAVGCDIPFPDPPTTQP